MATNCFGSEQLVKGTIPLSMTYSEIVPFLNEVKGFIGIRSGLCDIISCSSCHKGIIHIEKSDFWTKEHSEAFLGLRAMGLDWLVDKLTYFGDEMVLEVGIYSRIDAWTELDGAN